MKRMRLRHTSTVIILAAVALALAGCGAGSSQVVVSAPRTMAGAVAVPAPGDYFRQLLQSSHDLGPVAPATHVTFLATLRDPLAAKRAAVVAAIYRPGSKTFGKYQTLKDLAKYGPPAAMVARARGTIGTDGLSSSWQRGNTWLMIGGPARTVESVFQVEIHDYVAPSGQHFYASLKDPTIPSNLRPALTGTGHISSYVTIHKQRNLRSVPTGGLSPAGLRQLYDMSYMANTLHLNGAGQTVAFVEVDGFDSSDLNAFTSRFGLPPMHPTIKFGPTFKAGDETLMDLQVVHAIAPAANLTVYNCPGACYDSDLIKAIDAAVRNTPHGIISISLGGCEGDSGASAIAAMNAPFQQADALGESVFISSGDSGAFTCLTDNWGAAPTGKYVGASSPATAPGATAVGGTRVSVNRDGSWYREEVWDNPGETEGSGGGYSLYVPRPSWQAGPGVNTSLKRQVPDISADADPGTGASIKFTEGWYEGGGTSQAAPIWAGMTALMDQYFRSRRLPAAGFLNPALYALASGSPRYPPLHDITLGSNFVYSAGPGYDMATGLGTPDAYNLMRDLQTYLKGGKR